MQDVEKILEDAVENKVFPGASIGIIKNGEDSFVNFGSLKYDKGSPKVTKDTLYDVASITKSVPVGALALYLIEKGKLSLEDRVKKYIPELKNTHSDDLKVWHLMTYTVIWDLPIGLSEIAKQGANEVKRVLFEADFKVKPGESYYYTNAPAILLGWVIEAAAKESLADLANKILFKPLKMDRTTFWPNTMNNVNVAPSEIDFRGEVLGRVHDETAWTFEEDQGAVIGNAGLFSTSSDLLKFARMILNGGKIGQEQILAPQTINLMTQNHLAGIEEYASLGWELSQSHFMGTQPAKHLFGKTGFTGCSIVMDLNTRTALVILSNRTYPYRSDKRGITEVRNKLADLVLF